MSSNIWKYFEKISNENEKAKCKICKKEIGRKQSSTRAMWAHVNGLHPDKLCDSDRKDKAKKQESISNFVVHKSITHQDEVDELVVRIMVRHNNSFYFFNDKDLQKLIAKAYPSVKVHERRYYQRVVIPRMAAKIRETLKSQIGEGMFAVTSDGWSQPTRSPYLQSITVHFLNENFNRIDSVLAVHGMGGLTHSGQNIAEKIGEQFLKNNLALSKIICVVRDGAANMASCTKEMKAESFQCAAHFLHLCMTKAIETDGDVSQIVKKVKEWARETRKSQGRATLNRHQEQNNMAKKQIVMSVPTRWNSIYMMLMSFKDQKKAILSMEYERTQKRAGIFNAPKRPRMQGMDSIADDLPQISHDDFEFLRHLTPVMKIFDEETKKFSKEKSTASTVLPTLKRLAMFLQGGDVNFPMPLRPFIQKLLNEIEHRMAVLKKIEILQISMLLDPRFAFDEDLWSKASWMLVEEALLAFAQEFPIDDDTNPMPTISNEGEDDGPSIIEEAEEVMEREGSSDESIHYDIWQKPKSPGGLSVPSTVSGHSTAFSTRVQLQLAAFKTVERVAIDCDIFGWWKQNSQQFPDLAKLARIFHSIPATSVSSERLFSKAGLIFANTLRNRLSAKTVENILVVKANLETVYLAPAMEADPEEIEDEMAKMGLNGSDIEETDE